MDYRRWARVARRLCALLTTALVFVALAGAVAAAQDKKKPAATAGAPPHAPLKPADDVQPTPLTVNYGISDLARLDIDVSSKLSADDAKLPEGTFKRTSLTSGPTPVACVEGALELVEGHLKPTKFADALGGKCDGVWRQDLSGQDVKSAANLTVRFERSAGAAIVINLNGATVEPGKQGTFGKELSVAPADYADGDEIYSFTGPSGWLPASVKGGKLVLATGVDAPKKVYIAKKTSNSYAIRVWTPAPDPNIAPNPNGQTTATPQTPSPQLAPGEQLGAIPSQSTDDLDKAFVACQPPSGFEGAFVVCADAFFDPTNKSQAVVTGMPEGNVLRPNRDILVMVRHDTSIGVAISLGGTRGLFQPVISSPSPTTKADGTNGQGATQRTSIVSIQQFAPRLPGNVDIKISLLPGGTSTIDSTIELIVDSTYGAAVRLGFGIVKGGAVDRAFAARKFQNSSQSEIVATDTGQVDMEIVVGFAPFLEYFWGGRSYTRSYNLTHFPFGFSPYIALGAITVSNGNVDGFKSLYAGVEWELSPYFSIAATWIGRRVTQLSQGAVLGGPTADSGPPTTQGFGSGWGFVLNVSPDFLRIAASQSSAIAK